MNVLLESQLHVGPAAPVTAPAATDWRTPTDYSLTGERSREAIERGYAEAEWYRSPIAVVEMQDLLQRRNGPAVRDSIVWFGLLAGSATAGILLWGSWWAILPFALYGMNYGGSADSRWHESSHGTACKTDRMNKLL
jgi:fatty acid desaturase